MPRWRLLPSDQISVLLRVDDVRPHARIRARPRRPRRKVYTAVLALWEGIGASGLVEEHGYYQVGLL